MRMEFYLERVLEGIENLVRTILNSKIFNTGRRRQGFFMIHMFLYSSMYKLILPAKLGRDGYLDHDNCLKTWIAFGVTYR
jgi:hypothetical protein